MQLSSRHWRAATIGFIITSVWLYYYYPSTTLSPEQKLARGLSELEDLNAAVEKFQDELVDYSALFAQLGPFDHEI